MPTTPQIVTFILGSIVVIFGAYFATYLVARGSQRTYRGRSIQVLDRFSLSKDKSLMLITVYDKIYLVAFAAGSVTLLDSFDPETAAAFASAAAAQSRAQQPAGIGAVLSQLRRRLPWKKAAGSETERPLPFEAYLHGEADNADNLDLVYNMMQNRKEKEERRNALGDNAYFEEDMLK